MPTATHDRENGSSADLRHLPQPALRFCSARVRVAGGLRVRVQRELRDQFLKTCRAQDKPAAQVIREFMRKYVAAHGAPHETGQQSGQTKRKTGRP